MPQKKQAHMDYIFGSTPLLIKYKDVFSVKEFYKAFHEWLMEYKWTADDGDKDAWETYYGEKVTKDGAREIWLHWRLRKEPEGVAKPDDKATFYYFIDIWFHFLYVLPAEIVRDGMKLKVDKGEIEMKIYPAIQSNYLSLLEKSSIFKYFTGIIEKRIYDQEIQQRKKELHQEIYVMTNWIKQWFKMKRYLPYEDTKTFFPSYAWPSHLK